jgi:hypothetical protein
VLVSRDVRRDRKSVLVRSAPALAQGQAIGAASATALEIRRRDVSARWLATALVCVQTNSLGLLRAGFRDSDSFFENERKAKLEQSRTAD